MREWGQMAGRKWKYFCNPASANEKDGQIAALWREGWANWRHQTLGNHSTGAWLWGARICAVDFADEGRFQTFLDPQATTHKLVKMWWTDWQGNVHHQLWDEGNQNQTWNLSNKVQENKWKYKIQKNGKKYFWQKHFPKSTPISQCKKQKKITPGNCPIQQRSWPIGTPHHGGRKCQCQCRPRVQRTKGCRAELKGMGEWGAKWGQWPLSTSIFAPAAFPPASFWVLLVNKSGRLFHPF